MFILCPILGFSHLLEQTLSLLSLLSDQIRGFVFTFSWDSFFLPIFSDHPQWVIRQPPPWGPRAPSWGHWWDCSLPDQSTSPCPNGHLPPWVSYQVAAGVTGWLSPVAIWEHGSVQLVAQADRCDAGFGSFEGFQVAYSVNRAIWWYVRAPSVGAGLTPELFVMCLTQPPLDPCSLAGICCS